MRYYDPFQSHSVSGATFAVATAALSRFEAEESSFEARRPTAATIARSVSSGRKQRLAAKHVQKPSVDDAESWDFGQDQMLWARTRYEPWDAAPAITPRSRPQPRATMKTATTPFAKPFGKPFSAPLQRTSQMITQLIGMVQRAAA